MCSKPVSGYYIQAQTNVLVAKVIEGVGRQVIHGNDNCLGVI